MPLQHTERARLYHVGRVRPDPAWRMRSHSHAFHELICVVRGRLVVAGCGREIEATAGDLLLYPAGAAHAEWTAPDDPVESFFISFTCPLRPGVGIVAARDARGRVAEMVRWLLEDAEAGGGSARHACHSLLPALLDEFVRTEAGPASALAGVVRRYVQAHLAAPLTLGGLARVAGLSRCHFVRAYKQATGRTPMADVRAMRVQYARQLILGSALPLKEVAPLAGLGNEYAMSRTFRRCLDMPPGQLRRFQRRGRGA